MVSSSLVAISACKKALSLISLTCIAIRIHKMLNFMWNKINDSEHVNCPLSACHYQTSPWYTHGCSQAVVVSGSNNSLLPWKPLAHTISFSSVHRTSNDLYIQDHWDLGGPSIQGDCPPSDTSSPHSTWYYHSSNCSYLYCSLLLPKCYKMRERESHVSIHHTTRVMLDGILVTEENKLLQPADKELCVRWVWFIRQWFPAALSRVHNNKDLMCMHA